MSQWPTGFWGLYTSRTIGSEFDIPATLHRKLGFSWFRYFWRQTTTPPGTNKYWGLVLCTLEMLTGVRLLPKIHLLIILKAYVYQEIIISLYIYIYYHDTAKCVLTFRVNFWNIRAVWFQMWSNDIVPPPMNFKLNCDFPQTSLWNWMVFKIQTQVLNSEVIAVICRGLHEPLALDTELLI